MGSKRFLESFEASHGHCHPHHTHVCGGVLPQSRGLAVRDEPLRGTQLDLLLMCFQFDEQEEGEGRFFKCFFDVCVIILCLVSQLFIFLIFRDFD